MKKRMFSLFLAGLICSSALVGCTPGDGGASSQQTSSAAGNDNSSAVSSTDAPKEIKTVKVVTTWDPGVEINGDTAIFAEWGKKFGIKFDITVNPRDNHKEKVNILMTSKDIPDLLKFFQDETSYKEYGPVLFEPLDGYIEAGKTPNMVALFDKYPEIKPNSISPKDSKIYGFPLIQDFDYFSNLWYVRNDMLKSQGMDAAEIKTLDDLKKAMLALKKAKGGDYIASSRLGYSYTIGMVGAYFGVPGVGIVYDETSDKFIHVAKDRVENLKTFIEFENWMIKEKLLHPNFLTMTDQELYAGYQSGDFPLQREQFTMAYTPVSSLNPKDDANIEIKPIYPVDINGKKITVPKMAHFNTAYRSPWVIGKDSKAKDELVAAMDFMYSPEGVELNFLGIEGETFIRNDKTPSGYQLQNVQSVWTRKEDGSFPDGLKTLNELGYNSWWLAGSIPAHQRFQLLSYKEGEDEKASRTMKELEYMETNGHLRAPDPVLVFSKAENDELAKYTTPLNTYIEENISKFILGTRPMSEFDKFITELSQFEIDKIVELHNKKYEETKK